MNYSHSPAQKSNFVGRQQGIDENNDSLLDQSNSFDLKNQIYELTSKCNNIQYEKNKLVMSYDNALRQFKQKYAILEKLCHEKQEKQQKLTHRINELNAECQYLAQQNEGLKKQLYSLLEKNRTTPDFTSTQFVQEANLFNQLIKKEQRIQQLDKELQQAKENQYRDLRDKIATLQKENKKLKDENYHLHSQSKKIDRNANQEDQNIIKFKDATIQQLKKELLSLNQQLEEAKKHRASLRAQDSFQQRRKDERIAQLQQRITIMDKQRQRFQRQKMECQQQIKRLQNERKQVQKAKKAYQQQAQILTIQLSEVRALSFNDKIECKKQINTIKIEMQEQKNKLRTINEQKTQQNKRLRENVLLLNDQNQQLRDRNATQIKNIQKITLENKKLIAENEKYLRESNKWQVFADESIKKTQKSDQQFKRLDDLEHTLIAFQKQVNQKAAKIRQLTAQLQNCRQQLQNREEIVEIMKIQKIQFQDKLKEEAKRIKQAETIKAQKQKVISQLQQEIRNLKDDIRHLELANEQTNEKLQTLRAINIDIQNIKKQLELQKHYYEEMRHEEEELRRKHRKSQEFKQKQQSSNNTTKHIEKEELRQQIQMLKITNQQLHLKLSQAENEISKKGIDMNVKEQQIKKLKQNLNNPREINFQPLIETSKRNQFNAVFLQNKILLLQKQITGLKTIKEKQYEEYKKVYRKSIEQKYLGQIKKSASYINQLQKNIQLLNHKIHQQKQANQQMSRQLESFTKDNYQLKYQYSQTLQELNALLQKYKTLQTHCKDLEFDKGQTKKILEQNATLKGYLDRLHRNHEQKLIRLSNANQQIQKLNQTLMKKQSQIRSLKGKSPNSSFIGSQQSEKRSVENIKPRHSTEQQPSSDGDSLRSWIKKSPNFSRV